MRTLLWFTIVLSAAAYICGQIVDPDLWWHITVGRWIIANHAVPHVDYWNMFAVGTPWRAYSWLFEIVVAPVDRYFGMHGLYALKLLLAALISLSLCFCISKLANDWFFGSFLGLFAVFACHNHFTLRPQSFVWLLFAWTILCAEEIHQKGLSKRRAFYLIGLFCIWANLHITTALGIFTLFAWVYRSEQKKMAVLSVLLAFIGTLITPYMGAEWLTFFAKSGHPFAHSLIAEFQPANIFQHSTAFLLLAIALLLSFFHLRPSSVELPKLALAGVFSLAALSVVKFLPFAVIVCCSVIAVFWKRGRVDIAAFANIGEGIARLQKLFFAIPREGLAFLLICWSIVLVRSGFAYPVELRIVPQNAAEFIKQNKIPFPILCSFGLGGYMMYSFSDGKGELPDRSHLVPIDGRTNVVPHDIWEMFRKSFQAKAGWDEFINKVNPAAILWNHDSPFTTVLEASGKWCLVFSNGDATRGQNLYLRRDLFDKGSAVLNSPNCHNES